MSDHQPPTTYIQVNSAAEGTQLDARMRKSSFSLLRRKLKKSRNVESADARPRETCSKPAYQELTALAPGEENNRDADQEHTQSQQEHKSIDPRADRVSDRPRIETTTLRHSKRQRDWFRPGKVFSIEAPHDQQIHQKCFILLDSKEKQGKGVLVEVFAQEQLEDLREDTAAEITTVRLKCRRPDSQPNEDVAKDAASAKSCTSSHAPSSTKTGRSKSVPHQDHTAKRDEYFKDKPELRELLQSLDGVLTPIYMERRVKTFVEPGSVVLLDYTSSIPYDCGYADLGMLEDKSTEDLHFAYIQYLVHSWRLSHRVEDHKW